jgi:hypothetical protein
MAKNTDNSDELDFNSFVLSDDPIQIQEAETDEKDEGKEEPSGDEDDSEEDDGDEGEDTQSLDEGEEDEDESEEEEEEDSDSKTEEEDESDEELGNGFTSIIQMMHEQNGWEYIAEDFEGKDSIEGLNEFLGEVISQNSVPDYASDETKRFDDFVRKYGEENAHKFLEANFGETDYENLDPSNEEDLKALHRDYLKETTKFSDKKIERQIKKAEDLGELDEDFDEMKEFMLNAKKEKAEAIEKAEEEAKVARQQEFQNYLNTQKKRIEDSTEIAGFDLSKKDKEGLYKFAYEQGRDGKTGYQKLREEDPDLDLKLLMLAYKGVDKAKISKEAESKQAKKLKKELSRHVDYNSGKSKGTTAPKKNSNKEGTDYSAFVLRK